MTKRKGRILIWVGSILGIIVIAAVVLVLTFDWNKGKSYISAAVSKATGRQLKIGGDLLVDLGWTTRVQASQIEFENASWSKQPHMLEVGLLDLEINVWELLKLRYVLPSVTISDAQLILEKNADGAANWDFRTVAQPAVPEKRTTFPVIEELIINNSIVTFTNQETNARFELNLKNAEAEGFWEEPVNLTMEGTYQKQPLSLNLEGGSYENLRSTNEPYPLTIDLAVGKLKAKIDGNLTEPLQMKGEDVTLDIQGDDMANLFPLIRLVFPSTPPYRLKGRLKHDGNLWSFSNFSGRVGDSDLSGNIRVDTAPKRHVMKAELVSSLLDFKDLAGFIGGTPGTGPGETASEEQKKRATAKKESDRIFPDQRYDLERLKAMDADVQLRAKRILAPNLPIDDLNAKLSLNNGVLKFDPAAFGVANGRIELYSTFDGSTHPAKVKIDTRLRQLELKRFLGSSTFAQKTLGPIGGRITLSGTGESFRDLMGTASGDVFLVMSGGEISHLLIELAGLDVAEALGVLVKGDNPIPIRCAVVDLHGENGQMGIQNLVFDTTNTIIFGDGKIDLRDEQVDIVLTPVPKDFSPFSLRSFIRVEGRFKSPSVFPDPLKTGTKSLLQKIFNVFVVLVGSVVQPRDLGFGKDIDCDKLISGLQQKDPHGVVLKDVAKAPPTSQTAPKPAPGEKPPSKTPTPRTDSAEKQPATKPAPPTDSAEKKPAESSWDSKPHAD